MIGLEKCCLTSTYLQWLCHSGEQAMAHGPLVISSVSSLSFIFPFLPCPPLSSLLLSLFSLSLGDDTKWPTRVDVSFNPNTIKFAGSFTSLIVLWHWAKQWWQLSWDLFAHFSMQVRCDLNFKKFFIFVFSIQGQPTSMLGKKFIRWLFEIFLLFTQMIGFDTSSVFILENVRLRL